VPRFFSTLSRVNSSVLGEVDGLADVAVQVDDARHHESTGQVDHGRRGRGHGVARGYLIDPAVLDDHRGSGARAVPSISVTVL